MAQAQQKIDDVEESVIGSQELIVWEKLNPAELFKEGGLDSVLKEIDEKARSIILGGVDTAKDRDNIRAIAAKVSKAKTFVQKIGTKNTEEHRSAVKESNAERDRGVSFLQGLQDDIRKPLTEYEDAEKEKKARIEGHIDCLSECAAFEDDPDSDLIKERISDLEREYKFDWEEDVVDRASYTYDRAKSKLQGMLNQRTKYESDQKELQELRDNQAAQAKKDEEERIRKDAAEAATKEAEEKSRIERESSEKAAADQLAAEKEKNRRIEQDKKDAEAKVKKAEEDRIAAEKKAEADKKAAVQAEKDRAAADKQREREKAEKREANKKHRAKIEYESIDAIVKYVFSGDNYTKETDTQVISETITQAIIDGEIPHITITY